jgi:hypothetical protein
VGNHSFAAAPRERQESSDRDFKLVRAAYEKATGNSWNTSDSEGYHQNGLDKVPTDRIIMAMETVVRRTPSKINSFNYFIKEIVTPDPHNRSWQKKQLARIVHRACPKSGNYWRELLK